MAADTERSVIITRAGLGQYTVENVRGGSLSIGTGDDDAFTPVELFLAAIGSCTGADVDFITNKRAEPIGFTVRVRGDKIRDAAGVNRMENLTVEFAIAFPEGPAGDTARETLPRAVQMSHDRLCTVTRTVESGSPIASVIEA